MSRSSASATSRAARIVEQARRAVGCLDVAICADLLDHGRVNIFECWESQTALETFRSSGPDTEQRLAMFTLYVQAYDIADVRPVFGSRQSELAARIHARPMRSAPRCGHSEKDHHERRANL